MSSELRTPRAIRRRNTADDGCGRTGQDVRLPPTPVKDGDPSGTVTVSCEGMPGKLYVDQHLSSLMACYCSQKWTCDKFRKYYCP
uniref:SWIM-type domain-containing protein n=1 Tax=Angiostrongylus cantonensis TaxID=6313 RepID=A0A0K0DEM8_ANGCA